MAESPAAGRYHATAHTGGPWSPQLQHGGPPNALMVHSAERLVAAETGRTDLIATRLAAEFVGPVPVAEVQTSARIVRPARSAVLVEVELAAEGRTCLQGRVWFVVDTDTSAVAHPGHPREVSGDPGLGSRFPYGQSIDWRRITGGITRIGPGTAWARPQLPLVEGSAYTGLQRAALIGDSASGISAELDWAQWSFLNIDLDVHLFGPVRGDWLLMDAITRLGSHGTGLAQSSLSDQWGPVGTTTQTLLLAPRRPD